MKRAALLVRYVLTRKTIWLIYLIVFPAVFNYLWSSASDVVLRGRAVVLEEESRSKVRMNLRSAFIRIRDVIKYELMHGNAIILEYQDEVMVHDVVECCRHRFERPAHDPVRNRPDITNLSVCSWCSNCSEKGAKIQPVLHSYMSDIILL